MAFDEQRRWFRGVPAVLVLGALALYARGLGIAYFADDFQFVFEGRAWGAFEPFFVPNPHNPFYRPLQSTYLILVQDAFGGQTWPIHLLQVILHGALCALVYRGGRSLGLSPAAAALGGGFMLVSQANVHAVLSNDTLSQVGGTLFGYLSLYALYRGLAPGAPAERRGYRAMSPCFFAVALLFKETSAAFFLMALLIVARCGKGSWMGRVVRAVPYGLILVLYLGGRTLVVGGMPGAGGGGYTLHLGLNVFENAALLALAVTTPVPSPMAYAWVQEGAIAGILGTTAAGLAFILAVSYGLMRLRRPAFVGMLAGLAVLSLAPAYLLAHVSELYAYNALPLVALLVGAGLDRFLAYGAERSRFGRIAAGALVPLFFVAHVASVQEKAASMAANGERASLLLPQVVRHGETAPAGANLVLCRASQPGVSYSVFSVQGFDVLSYAAPVIRARAGRPGLAITFEGGAAGAPDTVALALDPGERLVRRVQRCP